VSEHPPAVIAAADQMAAAYNDMIARFPKITATFKATFDADAYQRIVDTLPLSVDLVGGPLDGFRCQLEPVKPAALMLVFEVGSLQHWYRRVECDWWTCYEWVRDLERP